MRDGNYIVSSSAGDQIQVFLAGHRKSNASRLERDNLVNFVTLGQSIKSNGLTDDAVEAAK